MVFKRYRKRGALRKAKGRKVYRKKSAVKTSRAFRLKVKRIIHNMAENKTWTNVVQNLSLTPAITGSLSTTSQNPWNYNLLPQLSQGTGSTGRIGNQVRVVKNVIRGFVNIRPYDATINTMNCPYQVKIYVFSIKTYTNFLGDMVYSNWAQFFRINNADTGFYGTMLDMIMPVNDEIFTLHTTRTFQLSSAPFLVGNGTSNQGYSSPSGRWSVPFSIDVTKYARILKYDDNTSARVTNKSLIIAAQVVKQDGSTNPYLVANDLAEIHFMHDVRYEDL